MPEDKAIDFLTAVAEGNLELVEELVDAGVDPSLVGLYGNTAMRNAVGEKNILMIDLLLNLGVDVNHRSYYHSPVDGRFEDHYTPLFYAIRADVVDALIKRGADVNAVNGFGETSLMCACYWTFDDIIPVVESLVDAGTDVNITAPIGKKDKELSAIDIANQSLKDSLRAQARDDEGDYYWQIENTKKIISILTRSGRT